MKSYEHRLVDVVNNPPSGETYDAIGREADAEIAALKAECADVYRKLDDCTNGTASVILLGAERCKELTAARDHALASAAVMRMTVMQLYDLLAEQGAATEQYDFKVRKESAVRRAMSALQPNAGTAHLERMAAMERVCEADDEVLRLAGSEGAVAAAKRLSEARADYRAMEERESNGQ